MGKEIERKFLVKNDDFKKSAFKSSRIIQGYLSSVAERTVRIRIKDDEAYITIKGLSNSSGLTRFEWEKEIPLDEAKELIELCEPGIIDKTRYYIKSAHFTFEIDEFYGENEGLVVTEIELQNEDDIFELPEWLGEEVTGDIRYYNSYLSKHPFAKW